MTSKYCISLPSSALKRETLILELEFHKIRYCIAPKSVQFDIYGARTPDIEEMICMIEDHGYTIGFFPENAILTLPVSRSH